MTIKTRQITADELLRMPDDGSRYELVRGELREMPPAGGEHGAVAMDVETSLNKHVKTHRLGRVFTAETGFVVSSDPDTVRAPDAAFVKRERVGVTGYWPCAPGLAVEVVSPNDTYAQVTEMVLAWLEAGTLMVLVPDPGKTRRTVTVYRSAEDIRVLSEGDTIDGADVVPGWRLPVAEVFGG